MSALTTGRKYDGYILRVFEAYSSREKCEIDFCKAIESVTECNLMEKDGESLSHCEKSFVFDIKPNEVKTFKNKV